MGVLNLFGALFYDLIRHPLLEVARLRRDFLFPLPQLNDQAHVIEYHNTVGELDFLLRHCGEVICWKRERSHEYVRVLLGDEIVQKAGRIPVALFHESSLRTFSRVAPRQGAARRRRDR